MGYQDYHDHDLDEMLTVSEHVDISHDSGTRTVLKWDTVPAAAV